MVYVKPYKKNKNVLKENEMVSKSLILAGFAAMALCGCAREVYLQPVPCEEECPACPCYGGLNECCPEIVTETVVTTYQVYDVPAPAVTYVPCDNGIKRCRTVCREVLVKR